MATFCSKTIQLQIVITCPLRTYILKIQYLITWFKSNFKILFIMVKLLTVLNSKMTTTARVYTPTSARTTRTWPLLSCYSLHEVYELSFAQGMWTWCLCASNKFFRKTQVACIWTSLLFAVFYYHSIYRYQSGTKSSFYFLIIRDQQFFSVKI